MRADGWLSYVVFGVLGLLVVAGIHNCHKCYGSKCAAGKEPAVVHGVCMCVERPE